MKLFYVPGVCSLSPNIVFREAGLPVELQLVDRATKKTPSGADYLTINPKGYVPALQLDDGQVLTEGTVIVQYLADQKPETKLAPKAGTIERYRLQEWLNYIATELHKGVSPLFNPKLPDDIRNATKERIGTRVALVEKTLTSQPFLMGQDFTVADAYLYVILSWFPRVGLDVAPYPKISAYFEKIGQRPAVKAALAAEAGKQAA